MVLPLRVYCLQSDALSTATSDIKESALCSAVIDAQALHGRAAPLAIPSLAVVHHRFRRSPTHVYGTPEDSTLGGLRLSQHCDTDHTSGLNLA